MSEFSGCKSTCFPPFCQTFGFAFILQSVCKMFACPSCTGTKALRRISSFFKIICIPRIFDNLIADEDVLFQSSPTLYFVVILCLLYLNFLQSLYCNLCQCLPDFVICGRVDDEPIHGLGIVYIVEVTELGTKHLLREEFISYLPKVVCMLA